MLASLSIILKSMVYDGPSLRRLRPGMATYLRRSGKYGFKRKAVLVLQSTLVLEGLLKYKVSSRPRPLLLLQWETGRKPKAVLSSTEALLLSP